MASPDIALYTAGTPNGHKVSVLLEELGLAYKTRGLDLGANEQKEAWFLKINPNGRIPAITDGDKRIFESGAVMQYLVDKYDTERKFSYAPEDPEYYEQLSWLMWQMGGLGPMQGQAHYFTGFAPARSDMAIQRYKDETKRLYSVLEARLQESPYLAGERYTIADIASVGWVRASPILLDFDLGEWPAVKKWQDAIVAREAFQRGRNVPENARTDEEIRAFFDMKKKQLMAMGNTDAQ